MKGLTRHTFLCDDETNSSVLYFAVLAFWSPRTDLRAIIYKAAEIFIAIRDTLEPGKPESCLKNNNYLQSEGKCKLHPTMKAIKLVKDKTNLAQQLPTHCLILLRVARMCCAAQTEHKSWTRFKYRAQKILHDAQTLEKSKTFVLIKKIDLPLRSGCKACALLQQCCVVPCVVFSNLCPLASAWWFNHSSVENQTLIFRAWNSNFKLLHKTKYNTR